MAQLNDANPSPAAMRSITLTVNGKTQTTDALADTPLLWVLRDHLQLVGTKYGCGIGQCGACTVHVNGKPAPACQIPAASVGNQQITTIEGLDPKGQHPLQVAWAELDVPQCGYCQAGQIMAAAALLAQNPRPTEQDVDAALAGHLCRCGAYLRIRAGVLRAAELAATKGSL